MEAETGGYLVPEHIADTLLDPNFAGQRLTHHFDSAGANRKLIASTLTTYCASGEIIEQSEAVGTLVARDERDR